MEVLPSALQVAFSQRTGRGICVAPGIKGSGNLRGSRTRRYNDVAGDAHHGSDAGNGTAGAAGDRNAILLHGDFQCRLGVAACGQRPRHLLSRPRAEIEARRCFGSDVDDAHGLSATGILPSCRKSRVTELGAQSRSRANGRFGASRASGQRPS